MRASCLFLLLTLFVGGQTPNQDPLALKLLKKASDLEYAARREGLLQASYDHTLSQFPGVNLKVQWTESEGIGSKLVVPQGTPEQVRERIEAVLLKAARNVSDMVLGKDVLRGWSKDEITLLAPDRVHVRRQATSEDEVGEVIVLGVSSIGLPQWMEVTDASGLLRLDMVYEKTGEKYFLKNIQTKQGERRVNLDLTWHAVEGFHFPSKVTATAPEGTTVQAFSNFQIKGKPKGPPKKDGEDK
jgi:hypothetical protein